MEGIKIKTNPNKESQFNYGELLKIILISILFYFVCLNYKEVLRVIAYVFSVFSPLIVGASIAFIINLPMSYIEKKLPKKIKKTRVVSVLVTVAIFLAVLGVMLLLVIPEIYNSFQRIQENIPKIIDWMGKMETLLIQRYNVDVHVQEFLDNIGYSFDSIIKNLRNFSIESIGNSIKSIFAATNMVFGALVTFGLGIVFSIYFLFSKEKLLTMIKKVFLAYFDEDFAEEIFEVGRVTKVSFEGFLTGQTKEAFIQTLLFYVSMRIFQFPSALAISVLVGICSYIPIFGAFLGSAFGLLIIMIESPIKALWFIVLSIVIQQIEGNIIYPRVVGKSVGLPGLWVFTAVTIFGSLAGVLGMLVSVPITSIVYTLFGRAINEKLSEKNIELQKYNIGINKIDVIEEDN